MFKVRMIALAVAAMSLTVNVAAQDSGRNYNVPDVTQGERLPPRAGDIIEVPVVANVGDDMRGTIHVKDPGMLDQRIKKHKIKDPDKPEPVFWVLLGVGVAAILGGMLFGPDPNKCGAGEMPPACNP